MRTAFRTIPFEVWLTATFLLGTLALGAAFGLPFSLPNSERANFVGIHYLYPLLGIAVWGVIAFIWGKQKPTHTFFIALPCYAVILLTHFNLKLWVPHINPALHDPQYMAIDRAFDPLVSGAMNLREAVSTLIPLDSNFYMLGFIALFYLSFSVHALGEALIFRALTLAAMIFQAGGALSYLVAPALGPFLYQPGVEKWATFSQNSMLQTYQQNVAGGANWIIENGGAGLTAGLAAMPSLHAGGSFLFLLFAARHERPLVIFFLPIWAFIMVDAVANRWHYLVDLPAGMLLAWGAIVVAERIAGVKPKALAIRLPRAGHADGVAQTGEEPAIG